MVLHLVPKWYESSQKFYNWLPVHVHEKQMGRKPQFEVMQETVLTESFVDTTINAQMCYPVMKNSST